MQLVVLLEQKIFTTLNENDIEVSVVGFKSIVYTIVTKYRPIWRRESHMKILRNSLHSMIEMLTNCIFHKKSWTCILTLVLVSLFMLTLHFSLNYLQDMNGSAEVVHDTCSYTEAYRLFRTMGLRHLVVSKYLSVVI